MLRKLLSVLDAFGAMDGGERLRLVIAGRPGWGGPAFWRELERRPASADALCVGYADDRALMAIAACARVLVFPSMYEGFGLPVVEAMSVGTPVVTSSAAALAASSARGSPRCGPPDFGRT